MQCYIIALIFFAMGSIECQEGFDGTLTKGYVKNFFSNTETDVVLSGREISSIDADAFVDFYEIRRLDLSNNEIEKLGDAIFIDQSNLEELDLSNNKI